MPELDSILDSMDTRISVNRTRHSVSGTRVYNHVPTGTEFLMRNVHITLAPKGSITSWKRVVDRFARLPMGESFIIVAKYDSPQRFRALLYGALSSSKKTYLFKPSIHLREDWNFVLTKVGTWRTLF